MPTPKNTTKKNAKSTAPRKGGSSSSAPKRSASTSKRQRGKGSLGRQLPSRRSQSSGTTEDRIALALERLSQTPARRQLGPLDTRHPYAVSGSASSEPMSRELAASFGRRRGSGSRQAEIEEAVANLGDGGKPWWAQVLDALDTPRAAVVSAGHNLGLGLRNILYGEDNDVGFDTFLDDMWRNVSFREVVDDHGLLGWRPQEGDGGIDQAGVVGFLGDVIFDPLTYLMPNAKAAQMSGRQAARELAGAIGREVDGTVFTREMFEEAAERIGRQGDNLAHLTDVERRILGITDATGAVARGPQLTVPGTGWIGQRVGTDRLVRRVLGMEGRGAVQRNVLPEGAARVSSRLAERKGLNLALRRSSGAQWARKVGLVGGGTHRLSAEIAEALEAGDRRRVAAALLGTEIAPRARSTAKGFEREVASRLREPLQTLRRLRIDGRDAYYALTESEDAIARVLSKGGDEALEAIAAVRQVIDEVPAVAERFAGANVINVLDDFRAPRVTKADFARKKGARKGRAVGIDGQVLARKYGTGPGQTDTLLGQRIVPQEIHPEGWSEARQIEQIVEEAGVSELYFVDDLYDALLGGVEGAGYVQRIAGQVEREMFAAEMVSLGYGAELWEHLGERAGSRVMARVARRVEALRRLRDEQENVVAQAAEARRLAQVDLEMATERLRAARGDLSDPVVHQGAEAIVELAEEMNLLAQKAAAEGQRLTEAISARAGDTEGELRRLAEAMHDTTFRLADINANIAELRREQDRLWADLQERIYEAEFRLEAGAERARLADEIATIRREIEALGDAEDAVIANLPPIDVDALQREINSLALEIGRLDSAIHVRRKNMARLEAQVGIGQVAQLDQYRRLREATRSLMMERDALRARSAEQLELLEMAQHAEVRTERLMRDAASDDLEVYTEMLAERERQLADLGVDELVDQWEGTNADLRAVVRGEATDLEARLEEIGGQLRHLQETARDLASVQREARERAVRLRRELRSQVKPLERRREAATRRELEYAERASRLYDDAARIRAQVRIEQGQEITAARAAQAEAMARVAEFEAAEALALADLESLGRRAAKWEDLARRIEAKHLPDAVMVLRDGMRQFGQHYQLPEAVAEAMLAADKFLSPQGLRNVLRHFDSVQNLWKAYAVLSPGFHSRNFFGGVFNNYLAGMEVGGYRRYLRAARRVRKGQELPEGSIEARAWTAMEELGVRSSGQSSWEVADNLSARANLNPASPRFAPLRGSRYGVTRADGKVLIPGGEQVENTLRGALFMDAFEKSVRQGMDDDAAARFAFDQVVKYHFDYDDLSGLERNVFRRVVPFYTWTRRNVPLMLEQLVTNPGKINNYFALKQNAEFGQDREAVVPSWLLHGGAIRIGDSESGGMWWTPDIGLTSLFEMTQEGPASVLSSMTPFIKAPLEIGIGRQFYNGQPFTGRRGELPAAWAAVPGLVPALEALGFAERGANGRPYVSDRVAYTLEQFMPVFARARRLMPSEERFEERRMTSWLSFAFGIGVRANNRQSQIGELYRRRQRVEERIEREMEMGFRERPEYEGEAWFDRVLADLESRSA